MPDFELYCINSSTEMTRITPLASKIEWSDNVEELAMKLQFSTAFNDDRFFPASPVKVGSSLILQGRQGQIGKFVVIEEGRQGRGEKPYIAMDYAWYLNKSKATYQFNNISTKKAVEEVCRKVGVDIGKYSLPDATINKIYFDKTHSDVLKDVLEYILQETGVVCRMRMEGQKIYFYTTEEEYIKPVFKFTPGLDIESSPLEYIVSPNKRLSLEETKNSIKIIVNENESYRVVKEVKDQANIDKFGLLEEIISIDATKVGDADKIANNKLKELSRVFEESSFQIPADEKIKAGKFIEINEKVTEIVGKYMISSSHHIYENGIYTCNVTIKSIATIAAENAGAIADSIIGKEVPKDVVSNTDGGSWTNGTSLEEKIWFFLKTNGFSDAAAAGVMGNIFAESRFNPGIVEGGSGAGYGLMQWTGPRRISLNSYAKQKSSAISNPEMQMNFFIHELYGPELWRFGSKSAVERFKKSTSPTAAAMEFSNKFEGPGIPHMNTRTTKATEYYNKFKGKTQSSSSISGKRKSLVNYAMAQSGKPYEQDYRRETTHFDCSSLVYRSMKAVGLYPTNKRSGCTWDIPKDGYFTKINKNQLQPGDVVLNTGGGIEHTAIFIGNGKTMEAKQWGTPAGTSIVGNRFTSFWRVKGIDG